MLDGRSRVTVIGERKLVDVALPATAPIGEYSAGLASLCGQDGRGPLPQAWSLAIAGGAPLPLSASLAESGIVDGQVLYLRDVARDPGAAAVDDIPELITSEAETQRRSSWPRALVVMTFGLAWIAAAAGFAFGRSGAGPFIPAISLIVAGLLLLATGWGLAQRGVLVPAALSVLTSLSAVPCLAVAGALLGQALAGRSFLWVGVIGGACLGVLMSLAATPEAVVLLIGLQLAVGLLLAPLLVAVHATATQVAAATVVAMLSVLGLAKMAAALVTVWSHRQPSDSASTPSAHAATVLLIRSRRLLTVLVAGPALALAVALPVLAFSRNWFAFALAVVAGVVLVVRAQQAGFAEELVPIGGAGLIGLFAALAAVAERIWHTAGAATVLLTVAGLALVAGGAIAAIMRPGADPAQDMPAGFPADAGRTDWQRITGVIGVLCLTAAVPLTLGVFGVFHDLMAAGRGMVG